MQDEHTDTLSGSPAHVWAGSVAEPGGERPTVGHPEVDAVLERLEELDARETAEHPEVYEDAHSRLHQVLIAAGREDSGPGAGPG